MIRRYVCIGVLGAMICVPGAAQENLPIDKARKGYQAFLELASQDDVRRPAVMRRLADMEVERAETLLLKGGSDAEAQAIYQTAITLYQDLLNQYPEHDQNDAVYYQMARALEAANDLDSARQMLTRLVERNPTSVFAEESEFRRGETYFSNADYERAAEAYGRVIERGQATGGEFLEQAWYKHGWSLFKLADYDRSQSSFLQLLRHRLLVDGRYSAQHYQSLQGGSRELIKDSLRAMSLGFSYGDGAADINRLLDRETASGFEYLLYQDLGELYRKEERFTDAADAYRAFVARLPFARHAPDMQLAVIETFAEAGFYERELEAKKAFVLEYALDQKNESFWTHHARENAKEVESALKLHLTELTQLYHSKAQQQDLQDTQQLTQIYREAVKWYRAWLGSFPKEPETPSMHFLLADLLFDQGDFAQAVDAYETIAYQYTLHQKSSDAAYAALLAYEQYQAQLATETAESRAWERRAIDSSLKFSRSFPAHKQATAVQTNAAEKLFARGDLGEANQTARKLLDWRPQATAQQRRTAWLVIGHSQFDLKQFAQAELAYKNVLELQRQGIFASEPMDQESLKEDQIVERLAASIFEQAQAAKSAGNLLAAANHHLRLAQAAPASALVANSQYEAASALMDLQDYERASEVLRLFRTQFPGHELQGEATRNLSVSYLKSGNELLAATELMQLAQDSANEQELRIEANYQAIGIFEQEKKPQDALASYEHLVSKLSLPLDEEIDAREKIATLYRESNIDSQYLHWVQSIISAHRGAGNSATLRSRTAAANAQLILAQQEWQPFVAVELNEPLQQNLRQKKQRMEILLDSFGRAAAYDIAAVTTAATYQIAAAYAEMANALMTSERPRGLNEDELEQYEFLLEEQAFPFEEQAIEIHENNVQRVQNGIYDRWIRRSYRDLAELVPGRYAKIEKGVPVARVFE